MTLTKPTFPAPDHDHDRCTADGILHAEQVCRLKAQKFTPIRRHVLQALLSSHRPLGAYEAVSYTHLDVYKRQNWMNGFSVVSECARK